MMRAKTENMVRRSKERRELMDSVPGQVREWDGHGGFVSSTCDSLRNRCAAEVFRVVPETCRI